MSLTVALIIIAAVVGCVGFKFLKQAKSESQIPDTGLWLVVVIAVIWLGAIASIPAAVMPKRSWFRRRNRR